MKSIFIFLSILLTSCSYHKTSDALPSPSNVTTCDSMNVSYKNDIAPMMQKYCNECHGGTPPSIGNQNYANYNDLITLIDSPNYILGVTSNEAGFRRMPPAPRVQPNLCEVAKIRQWSLKGAPNN
jgi:hypothetical protein